MGQDIDSHNRPKNMLASGDNDTHHDDGGAKLDKSIAVFIQNVIDIKKTTVDHKYTKLENVVFIDYETPITKELVINLINKGVSRVPVIKKNNKNEMFGYIRVVDFLKADLNSNKTIKDKVVEVHTPIVTDPKTSIYEIFTLFKDGNHIAFITEQKDLLKKKINNPNILNTKVSVNIDNKNPNQEVKIMGIVTMEDILEVIIGEDIKDESEYFKDEKKSQSRKAFMGNNHFLFNFIFFLYFLW